MGPASKPVGESARAQRSDRCVVSDPVSERIIEGVSVHVAGEPDVLVSGCTVTIRASSPDSWVGRIDSNLRPYADIQLQLRFPAGVSPRSARFVVGPKVRGETLISGVGRPPSLS